MALVWRGRNGPRGLFENDDKMDTGNDRAWFEIDRGKETCVLGGELGVDEEHTAALCYYYYY